MPLWHGPTDGQPKHPQEQQGKNPQSPKDPSGQPRSNESPMTKAADPNAST